MANTVRTVKIRLSPKKWDLLEDMAHDRDMSFRDLLSELIEVGIISLRASKPELGGSLKAVNSHGDYRVVL